jgi:hypothetical protein
MSHTNVYLPDRFSTEHDLLERVETLQFQLSRANRYIEQIEREFLNIPTAIREWGHVDLHDSTGKIVMTIIEKPSKEGAQA